MTNEATTPYQRLKIEAQELGEKINKLTAFIFTNDKYRLLDDDNQSLLRDQLGTMMRYHDILIKRIDIFLE